MTPTPVPVLQPTEVTVGEVRAGDVIYLGWQIPLLVQWAMPGFGSSRVIHGHIPPADPFGAGNEHTLELDSGHHLTVHRAPTGAEQ